MPGHGGQNDLFSSLRRLLPSSGSRNPHRSSKNSFDHRLPSPVTGPLLRVCCYASEPMTNFYEKVGYGQFIAVCAGDGQGSLIGVGGLANDAVQQGRPSCYRLTMMFRIGQSAKD